MIPQEKKVYWPTLTRKERGLYKIHPLNPGLKEAMNESKA